MRAKACGQLLAILQFKQTYLAKEVILILSGPSQVQVYFGE